MGNQKVHWLCINFLIKFDFGIYLKILCNYFHVQKSEALHIISDKQFGYRKELQAIQCGCLKLISINNISESSRKFQVHESVIIYMLQLLTYEEYMGHNLAGKPDIDIYQASYYLFSDQIHA